MLYNIYMKKLLILLAALIGLTSCAFIMPSSPTTEPTSNSTTEPTTVPSVSNPTTNTTTSVDESTTVPTTSVDNSTQPTITTPPTSEGDGDDFYYLNYSHVLKADDIKSTNGGTTKDINGLTWNYSSHTYKSDSTKGVQIGSANRPQTTPFTLKATLPSGIVFTSAYVEVAVAQGGSSTFEIAFGNSTKSSTFSKTDIEMFSYEDLNYEASTIQFSFKASVKALYVYSFGFSVQVPNDIELNLSGDADIEVDPVEPGVNNIPKISYSPISKETY